jgi:hypothetical protein
MRPREIVFMQIVLNIAIRKNFVTKIQDGRNFWFESWSGTLVLEIFLNIKYSK